MAWTGTARREHSREGLRYPSDMTDREWMVTAPFIPPAKRGGRRRSTDIRETVNERSALHCSEWVCMAAVAQMLPAGFDSAALFLRLARCRAVRCDQHGAGHEPA